MRGVVATIAVACLGIAGTSAVAVEPGCQLHNCDNSQDPPPGKPGRPLIYIGDDQWASGALEGDWIDFPGGRTELFDVSGIERNSVTGQTFVIQNILPYESDSLHPANSDDNFVTASGNVAEIVLHPLDPATGKPTQTVAVTNGTCAEYSMRLVITATPGDAGP